MRKSTKNIFKMLLAESAGRQRPSVKRYSIGELHPISKSVYLLKCILNQRNSGREIQYLIYHLGPFLLSCAASAGSLMLMWGRCHSQTDILEPEGAVEMLDDQPIFTDSL